jgi:hypothetical protein
MVTGEQKARRQSMIDQIAGIIHRNMGTLFCSNKTPTYREREREQKVSLYTGTMNEGMIMCSLDG